MPIFPHQFSSQKEWKIAKMRKSLKREFFFRKRTSENSKKKSLESTASDENIPRMFSILKEEKVIFFSHSTQEAQKQWLWENN